MLMTPYAIRPSAAIGVERFLQEVFRNNASSEPKTVVEQDDNSFKITLDMPGVGREQVSVKLEEHDVLIRTVNDAPRSYAANYELPCPVDAALSTAKLENGVLQLTLVKRVPLKKATELTIQ